jgi:hypothetical protein
MAGHLLSPLLPLASLRRLDLNRSLTNLVPVGAQGRSATLDETFHHCALRVFVRAAVDFLEEFINSCIATGVRIFAGRNLLIVGENFVGDAVPVLVERLVPGRCGGGGGCGGGDCVQRYFTARVGSNYGPRTWQGQYSRSGASPTNPPHLIAATLANLTSILILPTE